MRFIRRRCVGARRSSPRRSDANCKVRYDTSIPTISSNCRSSIRSRSSRPSPQPRSTTRFAPLRLIASATVESRCSFQGEGLLERILFCVPNGGSRYAISLRRLLRQQAANRFPNEIATVLQISSDDRVALRMRFEPALAMLQEFLEFLLANEIVFLIVEHRHEDVEVRQQLTKATFAIQSNREISTRPPFWKCRVEWQFVRLHDIAERLEETTEERLAAATRQDGNPGLQRDRGVCQFRSFLGSSGHGGTEHLSNGDGQERRCDVRPVVDVLREWSCVLARTAAHETDRVDVKKQRRRASVGRRFWIKDDRASKALIERLNSGRILVKQITQI